MKSPEIRAKFIEFFKKNGHEVVPSSSLIPAQDPTLLFANAGMNQFKDMFLGKEKRSYTRAISIQKCMRAGGKHNDLENVGFTKRHLTFFEMMGNFSFGDYFKKEAIQYAWTFLTQEMKLSPDNLHVSVFHEDDESYNIWKDVIGIPAAKIHRLGAADNFWQMGDTGPCGPCTEIYVDRGIEFGCKEGCDLGCSCDRYLEIWNNVFMQFDRQPDGTDKPLAQPGVDTGMGFERLASVMQNKDSVFEIDVFQHIIAKVQELTGVVYAQQVGDRKAAFHVLADHVRASSFLIADGVSPSNEGRGYVLRKVIRRAALFAQKLTEKNIFPHLVDAVIEDMGPFYPELKVNASAIKNLLTSEIEKFATNLIKGQAILEEFFAAAKATKTISGQQLFKLYDTYGFPIELTKVIAHERGYEVDQAGFEVAMEAQRTQSGKKETQEVVTVQLPSDISNTFTGYEQTLTASNIIALVHNNEVVQKVSAHTRCWVIAAKTPFYVERGGQVSDAGWLEFNGKQVPVLDLQRFGDVIAALIETPQALQVGDAVTSVVDRDNRLKIMKNHTATHLLQSALIEKFGKQIKQSGSLVAPDYLRFDFTYHQNLTPEEIKAVEDVVNAKIMENLPVSTVLTTYKDALAQGSIAFFGDKYNPENVRMIDVPGFSRELCGGTHVTRTGDIGVFKITESTALSAGQRRIVALTGPKAAELFQEDFATVKQLSQDFKVQPHEVLQAVEKLKQDYKELQVQLRHAKKDMWRSQLPTWLQQVTTAGGVPYAVLTVEGLQDQLKDIVMAMLEKKPGLYVVITKEAADRFMFIAALAPEHEKAVDMKAFTQFLKDECGLRGGGKPNMIQGGATSIPSDLAARITAWLSR